jgi:hypothetical protein
MMGAERARTGISPARRPRMQRTRSIARVGITLLSRRSMIGGPHVGAGQGVSDAAKSVRNGGGTGRSRRHVVGQGSIPEDGRRVSPARCLHRVGVTRISMLWPDIGYGHARHLSLGRPRQGALRRGRERHSATGPSPKDVTLSDPLWVPHVRYHAHYPVSSQGQMHVHSHDMAEGARGTTRLRAIPDRRRHRELRNDARD